jgi:hypothetical protein
MAALVADRLTVLRTHIDTARQVWREVDPAQFEALMVDYDIYLRMLHDALTGLADALRDAPQSDAPQPDAPQGREPVSRAGQVLALRPPGQVVPRYRAAAPR